MHERVRKERKAVPEADLMSVHAASHEETIEPRRLRPRHVVLPHQDTCVRYVRLMCVRACVIMCDVRA